MNLLINEAVSSESTNGALTYGVPWSSRHTMAPGCATPPGDLLDCPLMERRFFCLRVPSSPCSSSPVPSLPSEGDVPLTATSQK